MLDDELRVIRRVVCDYDDAVDRRESIRGQFDRHEFEEAPSAHASSKDMGVIVRNARALLDEEFHYFVGGRTTR